MNADPTFGPHPSDHSDFETVDLTAEQGWEIVLDFLWRHHPRPWPKRLQQAADALEQEHAT